MEKKELFSSRLGLILTGIGMAVGTGSIWRFPRIVSQYGGGSFLIPWLIFLFIWSIPLLILEFTLGKTARKGTIGSFAKILGENYAWMGTFLGFCCSAIMFYYSVVTGWCIKYLVASITGSVYSQDGIAYWNTFIGSRWEPILYQFIAMFICAYIIYKGVKGIEWTNKIMIPAFFVILLVAVVRSVTLPGAVQGLNYLFTPSLEKLFDYKVWLQALTQSAWSTGAGWGLVLTYAIYTKENEDKVLNCSIMGFGVYSASLICAIAIVPVVFAFRPEDAVKLVQESGPANTGLTFIWIPQLFAKMYAGRFLLIFFFIAVCFAAITSLIAMIELATRLLMDMGWTRTKSIITVSTVGFLIGVPSALNSKFFDNQDWVWGIGLLVSGLFISIVAISKGVKRFRETYINKEGDDIRLGRLFDYLIFLIPVQFIILVWWWFSQAGGWTDIFSSYSVGTCLFQWGIMIILFIIFNKAIVRRTMKGE